MADDGANDASQENQAQSGITRPEDAATNFAFLSTFLTPTSHEVQAYYFPPAFPNMVLSMPTELISTIFEFADNAWVEFMRDYYHVVHPDEPHIVQLRPGLAVLAVCSLWRQIALSHKKLWATFVHVKPCRLIPPPLLSFYLEQSKPHPLNIVIRAHNFYWPHNDEDEPDFDQGDVDYNGHEESYLPWTTTEVRQVLDALLPHASRWRRFALHICIGGFDIGVLLPIQSLNAPLLERFEVLTHNQWHREPLKHIKDKDDFVVALRGDEPNPSRQRTKVNRLTFARFDVVALHTFAPSFADLTVLELRNSHYIRLPRKVYANIFKSAPRLVHVSFMWCTIPLDSESDEDLDDDTDEDLTISAPCLEVLRSFTSDMALYMWKFLEAPRLKDIVISDASLTHLPLWIKDTRDESFDADVRTPFPTLERLVLDCCDGEGLSDRQLLLFCRMTSSITHLVLIGDDYMLDAMLRVGSNPVLWPNLRVLKLAGYPYAAGYNSNSGDLTSLAGLVEWRREVLGQQSVIEMDTGCAHTLKTDDKILTGEVLRAQFKALVEKGIVIKDQISYSKHIWPEWSPRAGQERSTNIYDLWFVEMLGAVDNPWYY